METKRRSRSQVTRGRPTPRVVEAQLTRRLVRCREQILKFGSSHNHNCPAIQVARREFKLRGSRHSRDLNRSSRPHGQRVHLFVIDLHRGHSSQDSNHIRVRALKTNRVAGFERSLLHGNTDKPRGPTLVHLFHLSTRGNLGCHWVECQLPECVPPMSAAVSASPCAAPASVLARTPHAPPPSQHRSSPWCARPSGNACHLTQADCAPAQGVSLLRSISEFGRSLSVPQQPHAIAPNASIVTCSRALSSSSRTRESQLRQTGQGACIPQTAPAAAADLHPKPRELEGVQHRRPPARTSS